VLPHDLNKVVLEMTHLLNVSIPKKVSLHYELAPSLPLFEADAAQIQQVVLNLVTNASEAIGEEEGVIRITTRQEELDSAFIAANFPGQNLKPGICVVLELSDTGCGMDTETLANIFDPFFTTKRSGRGLGLSAMLGILKGHDAGIRIITEPGCGSTFTIYFPAKVGLTLASQESIQRAKEECQSGRVLLVDDEEELRRSMAELIGCVGFEVIEAVDGMDAVAKFAECGDTIDLVILDLSMPRMDGHEALARLRDLRPGVPVILCSGFCEGDAIQGNGGSPRVGFIQKPFTLEELKQAVRTAMEA
jgi:two-component system, cell cycle sensor histidine kinase and response regulator CckA